MKKSKIHMTAICGIGMGSLAGILKESGHDVIGSDTAFYPPMSDLLKKLSIELKNGFSKDNVSDDTDIAIIGNAVTKENIEFNYIKEKNIPYYSMPGFLENFLLKDKDVMVVAGTHGKTTTTAILGHVLSFLKMDPGVLCGGVIKKWGKSYRHGEGKYFVIEGDEYDSACFDKVPKFLHYRPKNVILTGIEFDHSDIYSSLEEIKDQFKKLISIIPKDGILVANGDDLDVKNLLGLAKCRVKTYGISNDNDYSFSKETFKENETTFVVDNLDAQGLELKVPLIGKHNLLNSLAVFAMLNELGIRDENIKKAYLSFEGIKRRQELIYDSDSIKVFEDFAHHPTAVKMTLRAFRNSYPQARIWAVFEPRTNTSRRKYFENDFIGSFSYADMVIISEVYNKAQLDKSEVLDVQKIVSQINDGFEKAFYIKETQEIVERIKAKVEPGDIIIIMSNGSFDGIYSKLAKRLKEK